MHNVTNDRPSATLFATKGGRWLSEAQRWRRVALWSVLEEISCAGEVLGADEGRGIALIATAIAGVFRPARDNMNVAIADAGAVAARFGIVLRMKAGANANAGEALAMELVVLLGLEMSDRAGFARAFADTLANGVEREEARAQVEACYWLTNSLIVDAVTRTELHHRSPRRAFHTSARAEALVA